MRAVLLVATLAMIALLAGLTITSLVQHGPDPLTLLSLLVLGLFGFGILGALRNAPPDDE